MRIQQSKAIKLEGALLVLTAPYQEGLVADCRLVPGRAWDARHKVWTFPVESVRLVRDLAETWGIELDPVTEALPDLEPLIDNKANIEVEEIKVVIRFPYAKDLVNSLKDKVPGVQWRGSDKTWRTGIENLAAAIGFARHWGLVVADDLAEELERQQRIAAEMHEMSMSLDASIEIPFLAQPLRPYQLAGVSYLLRARKAILADEQGLGKSLISLATLVAADCLPAVIIAPKTLKPNWRREVSKFFPHLTVTTVSGSKPGPIEPADLIVLNYDICARRADDVIALNPKALVADEFHAIKNGKAIYRCPNCAGKVKVNSRNCEWCNAHFDKSVEEWTVRRTEGVMRIARSIPDDGLKLMLSGTPITNGPSEFVAGLTAIDRIDDFGGRWRFLNRYAPGGTGAAHLEELNQKLRQSCMIRRVKADVFEELPALMNVEQIMDVDATDYARYLEIEADVLHELATRAKQLAEEAGEDGNAAYWEKKMRAQAAEHLVRIQVLKRAAVELKHKSVIAWLDQFLESSDKKIIVFAEHVDTVESITAHFGDRAVKVRGGVSEADRMDAVDRFQTDEDVRVFVGNMASASEGLTLTAASDVAFVELGWTPAIHDQCAARCYGRVNDLHGATAWYLLAEHTIDDDIYALLEQKAKIVKAVTDGTTVKTTSVLADLVVNLTARGMNAAASAST